MVIGTHSCSRALQIHHCTSRRALRVPHMSVGPPSTHLVLYFDERVSCDVRLCTSLAVFKSQRPPCALPHPLNLDITGVRVHFFLT